MEWYALNLNQSRNATDARLHKAKHTIQGFSFKKQACNPGDQIKGHVGIVFFEAEDDNKALKKAEEFTQKIFGKVAVVKCSKCFS